MKINNLRIHALGFLAALALVSVTPGIEKRGQAQLALPFGAIPGQQVAVKSNSQSPALPLGFYIYLPPDFTPTGEYALVIWLHGYGEKGNGTSDLPLVIKSGSGLPDLINQHIAAYKTPTSNTVLAPGGNLFPVVKSIVVSPQGYWLDGKNDGKFSDFVDLIESKFPSINKSKVYLTGWSYGSEGTLRYARLYKDRLAAIAPFSGGGGTGANSVLSDLPIWAHVSTYENPTDGTTARPQSYGICQSRKKFFEMATTYPWPYNANGTVMNPLPVQTPPLPAVKASMAVYKESLGKWIWDTTGALNDYRSDTDVSAIFSMHVSSSHGAAWSNAYKNRNFWDWIFAHTKSGTIPPQPQPPVLASFVLAPMTAGQQTTVALSATDPENQGVTLSLENSPSFVSIQNLGASGTPPVYKAQLLIAPNASDAGTRSLTVVARDASGLEARQSATVTVVADVPPVEPPATGLINVAARKPASANPPGLNAPSQGPEKAFDGDASDSSRFVSAKASNVALTLDLQGSFSISEITLKTGYLNAYAIRNFRIEVKNSATGLWSVFGVVSGNPLTNQVLTLPAVGVVNATQVRLICTDEDNHRVRELIVMGQPSVDPTNIAAHKPVTAFPAAINLPNQGAANAVDEDASDTSRYVSAKTADQTLTVDLQGRFLISEITLKTGYLNAYAIQNFRIEVLNPDTGVWKVFAVVSGNPITNQVITMPASAGVIASQVKLICTDLDNHRVRELIVMGVAN